MNRTISVPGILTWLTLFDTISIKPGCHPLKRSAWQSGPVVDEKVCFTEDGSGTTN